MMILASSKGCADIEVKFSASFACNRSAALRTPSGTPASKWEFRRTAFTGAPGRVIRLPGTALEAADSLFYSINYRAELNSLIGRQARSEGLRGSKLIARIADLKLN